MILSELAREGDASLPPRAVGDGDAREGSGSKGDEHVEIDGGVSTSFTGKVVISIRV